MAQKIIKTVIFTFEQAEDEMPSDEALLNSCLYTDFKSAQVIDRPIEVVVECSGGLVNAAYSNCGDILLEVLDWDEAETEPSAFDYRWDIAGVENNEEKDEIIKSRLKESEFTTIY